MGKNGNERKLKPGQCRVALYSVDLAGVWGWCVCQCLLCLLVRGYCSVCLYVPCCRAINILLSCGGVAHRWLSKLHSALLFTQSQMASITMRADLPDEAFYMTLVLLLCCCSLWGAACVFCLLNDCELSKWDAYNCLSVPELSQWFWLCRLTERFNSGWFVCYVRW